VYPEVPATLHSAYAVPPTSLRLDEHAHLDVREIARDRGSFVVISPCNPWSREPHDAAQNHGMLNSLRLDLLSRGNVFVPTTSSDDSNGRWEEPGFAIWGLSDRAAQRLAQRYHQYAYYRVSAEAVSVCAARDGEVLTALPT
jgi:hypothetical protein